MVIWYSVSWPPLKISKLSPTLWRRTNARNVSFKTPNGGKFTLSTQLIIPNYPAVFFHRCSTASFFITLLPLLICVSNSMTAFEGWCIVGNFVFLFLFHLLLSFVCVFIFYILLRFRNIQQSFFLIRKMRRLCKRGHTIIWHFVEKKIYLTNFPPRREELIFL